MTTVSVSKRAGFTPFFQRSFEDVSEAARFVESWLAMHVTIRNEAGQTIDPYTFIRGSKSSESALRPLKNADNSDRVCPFCGAPEAIILVWCP